MEEKKKIRCSYGILVIVLFAALAFVTDYTFIERKTRRCDCPKCETKNNEVISGNTDKTQNSSYSYADVTGLYSKTYNLEEDESENIMDVRYNLYLNEDGTFVYDAAWYTGDSYLGNYYIEGDKIVLNFLFVGGHQPTFSIFYKTSILTILSNNEIIDNDVFIYSDKIGSNDVLLIREFDITEERMSNYKNKFKSLIENSEFYNQLNSPENN